MLAHIVAGDEREAGVEMHVRRLPRQRREPGIQRPGKPAPDLFLHAAARMGVQACDCIVIEDSPAGVTAATAAGMAVIGFVGGSHASAPLGEQLIQAGARTVVADLRHLKSTVVGLRGR